MVVVALALIDSRARVLMQQRPADKQHGGLWEFPGGKVEAGETCEEAIVREIDEELGVAIAPDDLFPISFESERLGPSGRTVVLLLYGVHRWAGAPVALEQGSTVQWIDRGGLAGLQMPPMDIALTQAIIPLLEGVAKAETPS